MQVVNDDWFIGEAYQEFKLRANEKGARVKVATTLFVARGIRLAPEPYVMNQPFLGCFTQPGHDKLPLAAFWADTDSWRNPEGSLDELLSAPPMCGNRCREAFVVSSVIRIRGKLLALRHSPLCLSYDDENSEE
jgi:hypothetical protein